MSSDIADPNWTSIVLSDAGLTIGLLIIYFFKKKIIYFNSSMHDGSLFTGAFTLVDTL